MSVSKIGFFNFFNYLRNSALNKAGQFVQWLLNTEGFGQAVDGTWVTFDKIGTDNTRLPEQGRCYLGDGTAHILITGLLTTDTISVPSYSDTPVCTVNGRLDIANTEKVGAITIKRAGVTWAFYKCDENSDVVMYDSSGNNNHGTITNATLSNFHAIDDSFYSFHNFVGYNTGVCCSSDGVSYISNTDYEGFFEFVLRKSSETAIPVFDFISDRNTGVNPSLGSGYSFMITGDERLLLRRNNVGSFDNLWFTAASYIDVSVDYYIKITRVSGVFTTYIKGGSFGSSYIIVDVSGGSGTNPVTDSTYNSSLFSVLQFDSLDCLKDYFINSTNINCHNFIPLSGSFDNIYIPRDENNTTKDIYNFDLQFTDEVKRNGKIVNSNMATFTGVEYLVCTLAGTETAVSYYGTSTPSISANRIDFTAGTMGYLLLDNGDLYKFSEGGGSIAYEVVNGNHATITNAVLANLWTLDTTGLFRPSNILDGFEYYDDDATHLEIIRVPYNSDGTKITPTISGYGKISENDASYYHNNAESDIQQYKTPQMFINDSDNFFFDLSGNANDISYADIVAQVADNIFADVDNVNAKSDLRTKEIVSNYWDDTGVWDDTGFGVT